MLTQLIHGVCGANSQAKNRRFLAGFAALLAAAIFTVSLAGCGDGGGGGGGNDPTVTSVTVSAAGNASSVAKGGKLQFSAAVIGDNNPSKAVTWEITTTGKKTGTTISAIGELTAATGELTVAADEAVTTLTVKATSVADKTKSDSKTVTVVNSGSISGVTVNGPSDAVKGGTRQYSATVTGTGAETPDQAVTWTITTTGIATGTGIDPSGGGLTVAADEEKTSIQIKATSVLDPTKSGTKDVSIVADSSELATATVTGVTVKTAAASVNAGETLQFFAVVTGSGAETPDQAVTWAITTDGKAAGTTINPSTGLLVVSATETKTSITVEATSVADDTKSGTASVTVNAAPTVTKVTVSAAGDAASVDKGGTLQFSAVVEGTNNPGQGVTWTITTTGIASGTNISNTGLLTVATGETKTPLEVKATSSVDTTKSGTKTVTVTTGSSGDDQDLSGNVVISTTSGGSAAGTATTGQTLYAVYGGNESVTYQWKKGGANVASGGTGGSYAPTEEGSYTVTVSADGYKDKTSATCVVSAGPTVSSVTVSPATANVVKGGTQQFAAEVTGTNTPAQTVTWKVTGGVAGTSIDDEGLLTVAEGETAKSLTVEATSTVDITKSGTAAVTTVTALTWTGVSLSYAEFGYGDDVYAIAYGGGKFVAVGESGKAAYSEDGRKTWTAATIGDTAIIKGGCNFFFGAFRQP